VCIANSESVARKSSTDHLYIERVKSVSGASISSLAKTITEIWQEMNWQHELAECMSIRDYFMSTDAQYTTARMINTH